MTKGRERRVRAGASQLSATRWRDATRQQRRRRRVSQVAAAALLVLDASCDPVARVHERASPLGRAPGREGKNATPGAHTLV